MRLLTLALAFVLVAPALAPAGGGDPPDFGDRPTVGQPLRFTDTKGHMFRPRTLILVTEPATLVARLPATTDDARTEEHLDFSGLPLIGGHFRERLAPSDAVREGQPIGPVFRIRNILVLDARATEAPLADRAVVLTANFPLDGAVSYRLGRLDFVPGALPEGEGEPAGTAYLLRGVLVIAGDGRGPLITDWKKLFGGDN